MNTREFVNENTLGGKAKNFRWKLDEAGDLLIERKFSLKSSPEPTVNYTKFSKEEIEAIINYVAKNEWTNLGNSVSKLGDGSEKEGLGKFMFEVLGCDITKCQASSQLSPILINAGIWEYNGKKRNIRFRSNNNEWEKLLQAYYERHLSKNI